MTGSADLGPVRARYAAEILRLAGVADPALEHAFARVPREDYLTPPPWRIFGAGGLVQAETADPAKLYQDVLVALDPKRGINNGQPALHAAWLAAVAPKPGEAVIQIGIGAGYYTAILAELVGPSGRVDAYEIEPGLAEIARRNLGGCENVRVWAQSGIGASFPDADIIYVSAGAPSPDPAWLRALLPGGRLIFPWQPEAPHGLALLVTRVGQGFRAEPLMGVAFIGCVGAQAGGSEPQPAGRALAEIRSLWFTADRAPDGSAIAVQDAIWFSSQDARG